MAAHYIETWGVFLGYARRCFGGWLLIPSRSAFGHRPPPTWTWAYEGVRETFEMLWEGSDV